ncbi:hypothetical protein ABK040_015611 [Willaertia magna]
MSSSEQQDNSMITTNNGEVTLDAGNNSNASQDPLDDAQLTNNGKHLSIVGKDLKIVPPNIYSKYGSNIESLDFSFNQLTTIENLSRLTQLKSLVLDNNQVEDIKHFPNLPNLETLWLNNNNIYDLDATLDTVEKKFPKLIYLSLLKNPACPNEFTGNDMDDYHHYRLYVLYRLNHLKFLDARQVTEEERKEAQRRGKFCKVVTPEYNRSTIDNNNTNNTNNEETTEESMDNSSNKEMLKDYFEKEKSQHSYFGYTRHVYTGKHSEGNRFIGNDVL